MITQLLTVNPEMRVSAKDALKNERITEDGADLEERDLGKSLQGLKEFHAQRKFKAAISVVPESNKLQSFGKGVLFKG